MNINELMNITDVRDVWRLSVAYTRPKSRTERPRKTKIGTEVAHVTLLEASRVGPSAVRDGLQLGRSVRRILQRAGAYRVATRTAYFCRWWTTKPGHKWKLLGSVESGWALCTGHYIGLPHVGTKQRSGKRKQSRTRNRKNSHGMHQAN